MLSLTNCMYMQLMDEPHATMTLKLNLRQAILMIRDLYGRHGRPLTACTIITPRTCRLGQAQTRGLYILCYLYLFRVQSGPNVNRPIALTDQQAQVQRPRGLRDGEHFSTRI